ncbi:MULTISPECIES: hypothetical protein [unclassified Mesorhizobium]|uniref:hypothetical protein n=1 Tax=unclassified Mesorhizobium TaxID=325217 RepID=UPI001CCF9E05|nr:MULTISPECIES: hypothetical protein [unclassified Mesorhizobium]MBZ9738020.1 hypothetical protein [Mesorhizobium sp. CO1-1-4]MBZ9803671.1 hypothetical protein [Mesorhizobium sp. ES1-6]
MTSASTPLASRSPFPFVAWVRLGLLARWYDRHLQRLDLAENTAGRAPRMREALLAGLADRPARRFDVARIIDAHSEEKK